VIARIAPDVRIIDLTHGLAGVRGGAAVLQRSLSYAPPGVHLAIVDPGVGTDRKPVVIVTGDGHLLVGPDNGLLAPAADALGGALQAFELTNDDYRPGPVSATFHGRDVFAPAAAYLALGVEPARFGPPLDVSDLVRVASPRVTVGDGLVETDVLMADGFGNLLLAATGAELSDAGFGNRVTISCDAGEFDATVGRTFADVGPGELVVYEDSYGYSAVALNGGNARERLQDPARLMLRRNL
jgi:hypothetical protein